MFDGMSNAVVDPCEEDFLLSSANIAFERKESLASFLWPEKGCLVT
jgi:hypothetical protein